MSSISKRQVFISSSTKSDRAWLRSLADALAHYGLRPWLDEREVVPGERWESTLEEALRTSDAILFVLTGDTYERTNVFFQLGFAKALGKQSILIVPGNHDISWIPSDLRDEELVTKKSPEETAAALAAVLRSGQRPEPFTPRRGDKVPFIDKDLPFGGIEFADNPEPRLAFVLLLDTSGSMAGQPIADLNRATVAFRRELMQDKTASRRTDLAVISFGERVHIVQDFSPPDAAPPLHLVASGTTAMGQALQSALEMVAQRKAVYSAAGINYYRPWIVLITDGSPTDAWQEVAQRVKQGIAAKDFSFFAVGVESADMETLSQIAPPDTPPLRLRGLEFESLFSWLSSSLARATSGSPGGNVSLPPVDWTVDPEEPLSGEHARGPAMAALLEKLAERNTFSTITDPVRWQRELRQDRVLPGRDG